MTPAAQFALRIEQVEDFRFRVHFDNPHYPDLYMDEPAPLGKDSAPNPARVLAAAIGNCLSASLVFCLKRKHVDVQGLTSDVTVQIVRNENKRLRIGRIDVTVHAGAVAGPALDECLKTFEDFCVVTQSVRDGIDVAVSVKAS